MTAAGSQLARLWQTIGSVLVTGGILLPVLGVPILFITEPSVARIEVLRLLFGGAFYVFAGLILHPRAWEHTPFSYEPIRVPPPASLALFAAYASWPG